MTPHAHTPDAAAARQPVYSGYTCPFCRRRIATALFYDLHLATFHVDAAPVDSPHVQAFSDHIRAREEKGQP